MEYVMERLKLENHLENDDIMRSQSEKGFMEYVMEHLKLENHLENDDIMRSQSEKGFN